MGRVSVFLLLASTAVLLVAFAQGIGVVQGGDVLVHMKWALAALFVSLAANVFTIFHATQGDRIIRELRARIEALEAEPPVE